MQGSSSNQRLEKYLRSYGVLQKVLIAMPVDGAPEMTATIREEDVVSRWRYGTLTKRRMNIIAMSLMTAEGVKLRWVISPKESALRASEYLEARIREMLFPATANIVVSAPEGGSIFVAIQPVSATEATLDHDHFAREIRLLGKSVGFEIADVVFTDVSSQPTNARILRAIKIASPASLDSLMKQLLKREKSDVNGKWLSHRLDYLRKAGLIIRSSSGNYSLTYRGLRECPVTRNRLSSDIERVLAVNKREW